MLPQVAGVSDLQRRGKKVLEPIKEDKDQIVLLAERNDVFAVLMNVEHYEELVQLATNHENDFWLGAMESSLGFWKDKTNDVYEKCL
jgi:hypothetical protein